MVEKTKVDRHVARLWGGNGLGEVSEHKFKLTIGREKNRKEKKTYQFP